MGFYVLAHTFISVTIEDFCLLSVSVSVRAVPKCEVK